MIARAVVVWVSLLALAIVNGALRQAFISRRLGEHLGHVVSTCILCALILVVAWASVRWMGPAGLRASLGIGLVWSTLTVAFELLAGHYLFGTSWADLLTDYNLARGRVWPLVIVTTTFAPALAARARGL